MFYKKRYRSKVLDYLMGKELAKMFSMMYILYIQVFVIYSNKL